MKHFLILSLIFPTLFLSNCGYFNPNGDVNGSVFIVTTGAGAYKLALVKVSFCDADEVKKYLGDRAIAYAQKDEQMFQDAVKAEAELSDTVHKAVQANDDVKESLAKIPYQKSQIEELTADINTTALSLEKREIANGRGYASLINPSEVIVAKMKTITDYFSNVPPDYQEDQAIQALEVLGKHILDNSAKLGNEIDERNATAKIAVANLVSSEDKFDGLKTKWEEYSKNVANDCLDHAPAAKQTVETDADGLFKLQVPKNGKYVVLATAQRSVGTTQEVYYWIVPFSLNGQPTGSITLANENELFAKDGSGAVLVDLRFKHAGYEWKQYDANGQVLSSH